MNLVIAAAVTWAVCLGLVGSGWLWLAIAASVIAVAARRLKVSVEALGPAALLAAFFGAIAWASHSFVAQTPNDLNIPQFGWLHTKALVAAAGVTPDAKALVLGLAIGDDSQLSQASATAFKTVSLTHLSAVSGANCAILVAAIYFLLGRLRIKARVASALVALVGYVFLVGFQPSVLRAGVMATVVLLASASGRRVKPIVALSLSVCILLSLDPELVLSLSFILSVAATLGLLWFAPIIKRRLDARMPSWLAATLSVSIAAQLFCAPILLQLQGGLPTYSLLANLLAEPLVAPVTILGLIAVVISPIGAVASVIFWVASLFTWLIVFIASWFSALPFATLPWAADFWPEGLLIALIVALLVWFAAKAQRLRNISGLLAIALSLGTVAGVINRVVQFASWPDPQWQVASCDVGQGDATVVRSANQIALIDTGKFDDKIDGCLKHLGISHIELLVLTHYDLDHIGAIPGAVRNRQIDLAMVTSFHDERPGANWVRDQLVIDKIPFVAAEFGMHGRLGRANWLVLNPEHEGGDAEDSNDGSIAMLFHLNGYNLLALADLGERGQMRLAASMGQWYDSRVTAEPLIMKVAHHGSADQYAEFVEAMHPAVALISVGKNNGYGHPTARTLDLLDRTGALIARTDLLGSISVGADASHLAVAGGG